MSKAIRHPDTRDVFFRNVSPEGSVHLSHHFAWDVDHFTAITQARAKEAGGSAERITQAQYLKENKK